MSKFNEQQKNINDPDTVNYEGAQAYSMSPELELASIVVTAMLEDQYYRTSNETMTRVRQLMGTLPDKKFIAQAAVYARTVFNMRSISHFIASEIAKMPEAKGTTWIRNFYNRVIVRPDDMAEIISAVKGPVPNAMKRAFADKLTTYDEYQLAKYALKGKDVNMIDIVRLTHPKATTAITKLVNGTLEAPETWEVKLTQAGQATQDGTAEEKAEAKSKSWKELVMGRKLGYMALVRNLRNINESCGDDSEVVAAVCAQLTNQKLVESSKMFPFRFYVAIRELRSAGVNRDIMDAMNRAMDIAVANVPRFDGKTLVMMDVSGSMSSLLSRKGTVSMLEAGSVLGAALYKSNDCDLIKFGTSAKKCTPNPTDSVATIAKEFQANEGIGYGTSVQAAFNLVDKKYDRIILISDMQCWVIPGASRFSYGYGDASANKALPTMKKRTNSDPYLYSFDLAAYGTLQFPESKVACVAGYDDKVFDIMKLAEQDKQALVNEIRKIAL